MTKTLTTLTLAAVALGPAAAGCTKAGMGPEVRMDLEARMESARPALTACYAAALREDRKLTGTMILQFVARPQSGQFEQVAIVRDDLRDQALGACVIEVVSGLALANPLSTAQAVTYPLEFAPNN